MSAVYPTNSIEIPRTMGKWFRDTDAGNTMDAYFCTGCGSRMVHVNSSGYISVKGGLIEGTENLDWGSAMHCFTRSKLPWVVIPEGAKSFEGGPIR
jgi:hypothetical protein